MSDLQTGLIALGAVLLVAVLLFNWWQEHRARQQMQAHFDGAGQDPLLAEAGEASAVSSARRREPGFMDSGNQAGGHAALMEQAYEEIDATCEAVIDVSFAQPVPGLHLRQALEELLHTAAKPVRTLVMNPHSQSSQYSSQIRADESYEAVQLAVLLANRQGALTDIDWSGVWQAAQQLAQRFDGAVEGPEQDAVLAQAHQLDALCAGLDGQVVLTIASSIVQSAGQFEKRAQQHVQDMGFVLYGADWVWMADSGLPWFALKMDAAHARLNLVLDVPNCAVDEAAFSRMAGVGRTLAGKLNAALRDEQGQPIAPSAQSQQSDSLIDAQVLNMRKALEAAGFAAGAWRTQRLFS